MLNWHQNFFMMIMTKFSELINNSEPVLVDFFAEWCGPCKTMAPILSEVSKELQGRARILKVDIDKNPQAANQYNIRSVPTLLLFKQGQVVWQKSGVVPARELVNVIRPYT
jgi:thioredoxin 1